MNVTDYDNWTDDENNNNCTINENIIDIIIPSFLLTIACGLSILCLMSLMVDTLIKPLTNKWWKKFYILNIQLGLSQQVLRNAENQNF